VAKPARRRKRRSLPRFSQRLAVGPLSVSPFCLGIVNDWRAIPAAFEMGVNFFFVTTDMHWPLYESTRKGLEALLASKKSIRDEIVVAGTCYPTQPEFCIAPYNELIGAVRRLARIDVYVAGGSYAPDLVPRTNVLRSVTAALPRRAIGASFHDRQAAVTAANHRLVDICYIRYNPAHPGAQSDLFPHLAADVPPIYNFKCPVGWVPADKLRTLDINQKLWFPERTDYYRYALTRPQVDGVLFSVSQLEQLRALDQAMREGPLTSAEETHLEELAELTDQIGGRMT
jgi:hypothetical protein